MLIAYVPLVVALAGLVLYALACNGKVAEVGRLLFAAAVLVVLLVLARQTWHLP